MDDFNLKLKLKSELKTKMPSYIFKDFINNLDLNSEEGKYKLIDLIFEKYTVEEVKDLILKKYDEEESYSKYKNNFLKTINRLSFDEKSKLKNTTEKEKKRSLYEKRKKRREENEKKRKLKEEKRRKEYEETLRKRKLEEERRRKEYEETLRKKKIEEETEKTNLNEINKKNVFKKIFENSEKIEEKIEIEENSKHEKHKTISKKLKNPSISKLKLYHADLTDIYFIYDYIKSEIRKGYIKNNEKLSPKVKEIVKLDEKLIDYKYHNKQKKFFTEELLDAIKLIYNSYFKDKKAIALFAVPPSEKDKEPQTKKSVDMIEDWLNDGKIVIDFKVYNESKTLKRTKTVESSKEGERSVEKHENSIEFYRKEEMPSDIGLIILDDITTSGNTMYACKKILIKSGLDEEDIIPLAIARTLNPYTEIYDSISAGKYMVYDENVEE